MLLCLYEMFNMDRIAKIILFLCAIFIVQKSFAQKKIKYGLGVEFGYNHLTGVIAEELTPYGHSGKQSNQTSSKSLSPFIYAQRNIINPHWMIDLGLGYVGYHHYFDFKYHHRFGSDINTSLKISWHYIQIPITLGYELKFNLHQSIFFKIGPAVNILLKGEDNYLDIILEDVYVTYSQQPISLYAFGSIAYQNQLKNKGLIQISPFVKYELKAQHMLGWGFFKNLEKAKNLQIGFAVSYLF